MAEASLDALRAMFPDAATESLQEVLQMAGGDVNNATNFLLSDDNEPLPAADEAADAADGEGAEDVEGEAADGEGDEDGHSGTSEEDEADEDEEEMSRAAKRLKTVEATPEESLAGKKANFVQFDQRMLRKTYLELLNLTLSKFIHTSVTMWSDDITEQRAALAMLERDKAGWWVQHFPTSEIDHVWRLLVSSHLTSKAFGSVVHVTASSFRTDAGGDFEVRVLVRDVDEVSELKRVGAGLLSVAPSSSARDFIFFLRAPLKQGQRESKTRLEEMSEFKLKKERRKEVDRSKPPRGPFGLQDPERLVYDLYKVEPSTPTKWVLVDSK